MHKITKVAVIGDGKMGTSIFYHLNGFDFQLAWLCSSEEEKEKAGSVVSSKNRRLWKSGAISEDVYASRNEKTKVTASPADLKDCNLIIEAVTENLETKRTLFKSLDEVVNPSCIFATNSSSILPSRLVPSEKRKSRVAGLHFFYPVVMKNTVELITGLHSSEETAASLHDFLMKINKTPFHQDESQAFVLNRILLDLQAGAFSLIQNGGWFHYEIDELVRTCFFPTGVFEFFDHVGIDIMLASIRNYTENAKNPEFYTPMINLLEAMVDYNHLGIKTGQGFYTYSGKKGTHSAVVTIAEKGEA